MFKTVSFFFHSWRGYSDSVPLHVWKSYKAIGVAGRLPFTMKAVTLGVRWDGE